MWYSVYDEQDRYERKEGAFHNYHMLDWELKIEAQYCAEDFHSQHDGWEISWPVNITLYESETGPAIATFEVEREAEPVFYARKIS